MQVLQTCLMAKQHPTPEQLDAWASVHFRYEAQMLVAGASEVAHRYKSMPAQDGFHDETIDDALLEATLVHIRLLDEFLAGSRHENAVNARHWVPGWSTRCVTKEVREQIDAQVAHLSLRRAPSQRWDVRGYGYACCQELDRFLDAVAARNPERSAAFDGAREHVRRGLSCLGP
jgi:hypothetical protein